MSTRARLTAEIAGLVAAGLTVRLIAEALHVSDALTGFVHGRRGDIYPAIVGLAGSLLGFVIASLTIILGYTANSRLDVVRRSTSWPKLFSSFTASMRWAGYTTILSILALLFDRDEAASLFLEVGLLVSIAGSMFVVGRMIWVLHRIVQVMTAPAGRAAGT